MKLATKLVSLFMLLILLVLAVDGWLSVTEDRHRYERTERREVTRLATALRTTAFAGVSGHAQTIAVIEQVNAVAQHMRCRWVWFDQGADRREQPRAAVSRSDIEGAADGILFPVEVREQELRLAYVHIPLGDERIGGLEMEADAQAMRRLRTAGMIRSLRVAGALILLSAVVAVFFGDRLVARPLQQLIDKTRRVGRGDLTGPIAVRGRNELSELGASLNRMCEELQESRERVAEEHARRIDTIEQLRHADRLRTVGQLAAGVAHELGTPLNVVSGRAGMIAGGRLAGDEVAASARIIKEQSDRISKIVRQLLDFARASPPEITTVDLGELVGRTIQMLEPAAKKAGVEFATLKPERPVEVAVDAGRIQQVLTNLLVNAIQAMPEGGPVAVRLERMRACRPDDPGAEERSFVRVDVEDGGPGIAADVVDRVFDPFFTTKDVGEGTGMGLSVAYGIAREHGGWIAVESDPGRGACFSLLLPAEDLE